MTDVNQLEKTTTTELTSENINQLLAELTSKLAELKEEILSQKDELEQFQVASVTGKEEIQKLIDGNNELKTQNQELELRVSRLEVVLSKYKGANTEVLVSSLLEFSSSVAKLGSRLSSNLAPLATELAKKGKKLALSLLSSRRRNLVINDRGIYYDGIRIDDQGIRIGQTLMITDNSIEFRPNRVLATVFFLGFS